jgi:hypothetical protein
MASKDRDRRNVGPRRRGCSKHGLAYWKIRPNGKAAGRGYCGECNRQGSLRWRCGVVKSRVNYEKNGCPTHGFEHIVWGKHYCRVCALERGRKRRAEKKQMLVDRKGGGCAHCGKTGPLCELEFHHPNPSEKQYKMTHLLHHAFWRAEAEAKKCILLCKGCHQAEHQKHGWADYKKAA